MLSWMTINLSYDVWGGLVIAPALFALTYPVARRAARREGDQALAKILMLGLAIKLVGSVVRFVVGFEVYGGVFDADGYHDAGKRLAVAFLEGNYHFEGRVVGTGFIKIVTGVLYSFIGPTKLGGFFVFSWLGYCGLYFFYRALCTGVPEGDRRRYALLLFFLPSLVYWPSSIGKDAWMTLTLGLSCYGAARVLTGIRGGFPFLVVGLTGAAMVRPHVSSIVILALLVAYVLKRTERRGSLQSMLKPVGVTALLIVTIVIAQQAASYFGVEGVDSESVQGVLVETSRRTAEGGSEFAAPEVTSPAQFPNAVISVLFRPFPHEAHNTQAIIASFEGLFLLIAFVVSRRRIYRAACLAFRRPYVTFCLTYSVLFVYVFSRFGNFGIIARQRVQLYGFVLVLLVLPLVASSRRAEVPDSTGRPQ